MRIRNGSGNHALSTDSGKTWQAVNNGLPPILGLMEAPGGV